MRGCESKSNSVVACNSYCAVNLFFDVVEFFSHISELSTVHRTRAVRLFFSRLTLLTHEKSPGEL